MKSESIKCDVCGAEKQSVNHWWKGVLLGFGISIFPFESKFVTIEKEEFHFCGQKCAIQWASQQLSRKV